MVERKMRIWIGSCVAFLVGVAALAASAEETPFPRPPQLEPRVAFWRRIYTEVDTGHGLLHDANDLGIVYEEVTIPAGLSRRGRDHLLDRHRRHLKKILRLLAQGRRSGLSEEEKRILALFPADVSNRTLRNAATRIRFQLGQADKFRAGLVRQGRWERYMDSVFEDRGLPSELSALPHVESSFNPDARSHVGASGIWQFTRSTGRLFMRVDHVVDERNDPFLATVAAARLLKADHDRVGTWPLALTAYNHGVAGMERAVRRLGTNDIVEILDRYQSRSFGFASRNFYCEFLAALEVHDDPQRWFGPLVKDPPEDPEIVILEHYYAPRSLATAFGITLDALRDANPALQETVWSGQKRVPQGYPLRVPRDPLRAAPKVVLAALPDDARFEKQVPDLRYRVRRGDTLGRIARRHGVRLKDIMAVNNLRSARFIRVGQVLELPVRGGTRRPPERIAEVRRSTAPSHSTRSAVPADGVYEVRHGDTLDSIARRYGVSPRDLAEVNRVRNPRELRVGQELQLPDGATTAGGGNPGVYTVRRGDTIDGIARRFGVSQNEIVGLNGIRDRHSIRAGQRLFLPKSD